MKSTRKLLMATMLLVLSLTAVVASTFAWFSIQTNPQIEEVQIEVTSGQGLRISLDATSNADGTYKTNWSATEFWTAVGLAANAIQLDTVTLDVDATPEFVPGVFNRFTYTSPTGSDPYGFYSYETAFSNKSYTTPDPDAVPTYIEFDVWFEADTDLEVLLSAGNVAGATADTNDGLAANITRIGFNVDGGSFYIYEPNPRATTGYGTGNAAGQFFNAAFLSGNFPELINEVSGATGQILLIENTGTWELPADHLTAYTAADKFDGDTDLTAFPLFNISGYLVEGVPTPANRQKVTVYIWLEGWDGDATDTAKGALIDVFMRFVGQIA